MEKEIPTAEEQLMIYGTKNSIEAMIEFAKLHVEAALKEASEKGMVEFNSGWLKKRETIHPGQLFSSVEIKLNKDSILNSYPLDKIK